MAPDARELLEKIESLGGELRHYLSTHESVTVQIRLPGDRWIAKRSYSLREALDEAYITLKALSEQENQA